MSQEPDIRLQVRIRNARILRAMKAAGIHTVADLCRQAGCPGDQGAIGELINFRRSPINKAGEWRSYAVAIATALHREPDELWPEYLQRIEAAKTETHIDVTVEQFASLAGEKAILDHDSVKRLLATIPERYRQVIEMRYGLNGMGEHAQHEIAERLGVTKSRVAQLEEKALKNMKWAADNKLKEKFQ